MKNQVSGKLTHVLVIHGSVLTQYCPQRAEKMTCKK